MSLGHKYLISTGLVKPSEGLIGIRSDQWVWDEPAPLESNEGFDAACKAVTAEVVDAWWDSCSGKTKAEMAFYVTKKEI